LGSTILLLFITVFTTATILKIPFYFRTYTEYAVVVQAFNRVGPGPMSKEHVMHTAEGKPDQPPQVEMSLEVITIRFGYLINFIFQTPCSLHIPYLICAMAL